MSPSTSYMSTTYSYINECFRRMNVGGYLLLLHEYHLTLTLTSHHRPSPSSSFPHLPSLPPLTPSPPHPSPHAYTRGGRARVLLRFSTAACVCLLAGVSVWVPMGGWATVSRFVCSKARTSGGTGREGGVTGNRWDDAILLPASQEVIVKAISHRKWSVTLYASSTCAHGYACMHVRHRDAPSQVECYACTPRLHPLPMKTQGSLFLPSPLL